MNQVMYEQLAKIEKKHWWFIGRRKLTETILSSFIRTKKQKGIDLGCGTGGNLKLLKKYCHQVSGLDLSKFALNFAKKHQTKAKLIQGDINQLKASLPANSFDLVTVFNVLYHQWVKNDVSALKQIFRILKPRGYLLINEPAFSILMRKHDILDMGKARYFLSEMEKMLKQAGFEIKKSTYFNSICFLPALLLAFVDFFRPKENPKRLETQVSGELKMPPKIVNQLLIKILAQETKVIKVFGKIPFGVNLLCLAQKPKVKH